MRFSTIIAGTGIFLSVTGGWVLLVIIPTLTARFFGTDPSPETMFGWTAVALVIVTVIAFFIALLHARSSDS